MFPILDILLDTKNVDKCSHDSKEDVISDPDEVKPKEKKI
jgi:hypothetical protein